MGSVPGAVATRFSLFQECNARSSDPVATAPGTDCYTEKSSHLREQNRQRDFRSEHAARVVTTERYDDDLMLSVVLRIDVSGIRLAARQPRRPLRHRRTRRIETCQGQHIQLAK